MAVRFVRLALRVVMQNYGGLGGCNPSIPVAPNIPCQWFRTPAASLGRWPTTVTEVYPDIRSLRYVVTASLSLIRPLTSRIFLSSFCSALYAYRSFWKRHGINETQTNVSLAPYLSRKEVNVQVRFCLSVSWLTVKYMIRFRVLYQYLTYGEQCPT